MINIINNNDMLNIIKENNISNKIKICEELKITFPEIDETILLQLYDKCISIRQSRTQNNGNFLENTIEFILVENSISYRKQVTINKDGYIIGFNEKRKNCYHIIDFVIEDDIDIGNSITNYKVVSCKTTCRERWTQDNWAINIRPKLYILITISNDYPLSNRFIENDKRKIITCYPKIKDDRKYKLNFENLIEELNPKKLLFP